MTGLAFAPGAERHPQQFAAMAVQVPVGTTAIDAVRLSGIAELFEGLDIDSSDMGVFGKSIKPAMHEMQVGERVEIYRPLLIDPKEVRKQRAEKAAKEKKST